MREITSRSKIESEFITRTSATVRDYLRAERNEEHSSASIETALRQLLDRKVDLVYESMPEMLTSPGSEETREFLQLVKQIENATVASPVIQAETAAEEHPAFNGNRSFSPTRLAAMMGYLSSKGIELYKTKLNKLLFYSDLTAYYLTGRGISGSRYVHLPYGPVPDTYEEVIALAELSGNISFAAPATTGPSAKPIKEGKNAMAGSSELDETDRIVLDWVIENYGSLSASEITEMSHQEIAYKNTRAGESIAYRYSEFLKKLPRRDLLKNKAGN